MQLLTNYLLFPNLEGYAEGDAAVHKVGEDGIDACPEAVPLAVVGCGPSCLGKCEGAGVGHVEGAVDVADGFAPKCAHYAYDVVIGLVQLGIAGVPLVGVLQGEDGHAPVVGLGEVALVLGIVKIAVLAGGHYELVAGGGCELDGLGGEGAAPCYECYVLGVWEQVSCCGWPDIVHLDPQDGFLAFGPEHVPEMGEEVFHDLVVAGVSQLCLEGLAPGALSPVGADK